MSAAAVAPPSYLVRDLGILRIYYDLFSPTVPDGLEARDVPRPFHGSVASAAGRIVGVGLLELSFASCDGRVGAGRPAGFESCGFEPP